MGLRSAFSALPSPSSRLPAPCSPLLALPAPRSTLRSVNAGLAASAGQKYVVVRDGFLSRGNVNAVKVRVAERRMKEFHREEQVKGG
jgi:hypothetical protein